MSAAKETLLSCSAILRAFELGIGTLNCAGVLAGVGGTLLLFSPPGVPELCSQACQRLTHTQLEVELRLKPKLIIKLREYFNQF